MKNKMFRGSQQQDAQEFLRCLLTQIHDEIKVTVPDTFVCGCGLVSCDQSCHHRDSMISCASHDSNASTEVHQKTTNSAKNSPLLKKRTKHNSQKGSSYTSSHSTHSSPAIQPKLFNKGKSKMLSAAAGMGAKISVESIPQLVSHHGGSKLSLEAPPPSSSSELVKSPDDRLKWSKDDLFVADLIMRTVAVHRQYFAPPPPPQRKEEGTPPPRSSELMVPASRSRSSTPTLSQPHKLLRSKDSSSSVSSYESTQGCGRDGQGRIDCRREGGRDPTEGNRREDERAANPAAAGNSVEDTDGRVESSVTAGMSRDSVPPSPVPSHQSTSSSVMFRERRRRGKLH